MEQTSLSIQKVIMTSEKKSASTTIKTEPAISKAVCIFLILALKVDFNQ